jgi:hypothetical protein
VANVKTVQDKGDKAALLILDDGSKPVWTPDRELARTLLGKPIPPDWIRKDGEYGPQAFPPKSKGQGRYRDTKEAFEAEAASRLAWQEVEEERKDRRTALMTAAEVAKAFIAQDPTPKSSPRPAAVIGDLAETFYQWLRSSPAVSEPVAERDVASKGEAEPTSKGLGPNRVGRPMASPAGDTSVGEGEAPATRPGEGQPKPSPGFPMSPAECNHKGISGHWLPTKTVGGQARCPRCGESAVIYMETA